MHSWRLSVVHWARTNRPQQRRGFKPSWCISFLPSSHSVVQDTARLDTTTTTTTNKWLIEHGKTCKTRIWALRWRWTILNALIKTMVSQATGPSTTNSANYTKYDSETKLGYFTAVVAYINSVTNQAVPLVDAQQLLQPPAHPLTWVVVDGFHHPMTDCCQLPTLVTMLSTAQAASFPAQCGQWSLQVCGRRQVWTCVCTDHS